ncbi:MAG TPA: chemotaxis protein CheC [Anaerovoracaceae bacterium]|nr:chemotaxis protein CheC [Anaerovoracaceae bacterium]
MFKNYEELNDTHIDVLREIGNIGAGNAATALANILDEQVEIGLPIVRITDFDTAIEAMGGAETMKVGVLLNFSGEANGMIMFLLNMQDSKKILDILLQGYGADKSEVENDVSEIEISAIKEIGNILGASYVGSISSLTGLKINLSIPYIAIDMAGALMSVPIIEFGAIGDKLMFIEENFLGTENNLKSNVIMFAQIDTLKIIMEKLGIGI